MRNDYGSLVETWKVDLIIDRAKRKGFRRDELEDVQQEVMLAVLDFKYDPAKANGATEATAITALIDKQLTFLQRGSARQHKHEQEYRRQHFPAGGNSASVPYCPSHENQVDLAIDVEQTVARLALTEQTICAALSNGQPRSQIAKKLRITRYKLDCIIEGIREQFKAMGLDDWMCE